ncbi:hypothetical protein [Streptomyces rochei]|uniref:hypothetical protein n=1 Tax=Streptomyces rochei TaxID=1928 RepID=UPI0037AF28B1
MDERFSYRGPALVAGIQLPNVRLHEIAPGAGLRAWEGLATFSVADAPAGFPANLDLGKAASVELPDGRVGEALITNKAFDGRHWTVELQGSGPAPR